MSIGTWGKHNTGVGGDCWWPKLEAALAASASKETK